MEKPIFFNVTIESVNNFEIGFCTFLISQIGKLLQFQIHFNAHAI